MAEDDIESSFEGYPPVMTAGQVREALAIGDAVLGRLISEGVLRPFKHRGSRARRFLKGQVMTYVRNRTSKEK